MNDSNAESCITINDDNEEAQTHSSSDFLCSQQDPQYAGTVVSNSDSNSLRSCEHCGKKCDLHIFRVDNQLNVFICPDCQLKEPSLISQVGNANALSNSPQTPTVFSMRPTLISPLVQLRPRTIIVPSNIFPTMGSPVLPMRTLGPFAFSCHPSPQQLVAVPISAFSSMSGSPTLFGGPFIQNPPARVALISALQQRSIHLITAQVPPSLPTVLTGRSIIVQQRAPALHSNPNLIDLTSRYAAAASYASHESPMESDPEAAVRETVSTPSSSTSCIVMPPPIFTSSVALSATGEAVSPASGSMFSDGRDESAHAQHRASHTSHRSHSHSRSGSRSHSHSRSPSVSRERGDHSHSEHRHHHHHHHHQRQHSSGSYSQNSSHSLVQSTAERSVSNVSQRPGKSATGPTAPGAGGAPMRRQGRGRPPGALNKKEPLEGMSERALRKSAQLALAAIALADGSSSGVGVGGLKELMASQSPDAGDVPRRSFRPRAPVPKPKEADTRQKPIEWKDPRVCASTRQCYGPDCLYRARPGSKYCSDACGVRLAEARIRKFLPDKFKAWKESGPPAACERSRAQLEKIARQRSDLIAKMGQINSQRQALRSLLTALEDVEPTDADDTDAEEENPASVFCVLCGHEVSVTRAPRHIDRCFAKAESQTAFGSRVKSKRPESLEVFCEAYCDKTRVYCKRLKFICPEHYKPPPADNLACGFPLSALELVSKSAIRDPELPELELASDVVNLVSRLGLMGISGDGEELDVVSEYSSAFRRSTRSGDARQQQQLHALESAVCRVRRSECTRHHMWERQRAALLDLHLVRVWQSLDDLLDAERVLVYADRQRRGFIGVLLNSTIAHVLPSAVAVPASDESQPSQSVPSSLPESCSGEVATDGTSACGAATVIASGEALYQKSDLPVSTVAEQSGAASLQEVSDSPLEPMEVTDTLPEPPSTNN